MTATKVTWIKSGKSQKTWASTFYLDGKRYRKQGFDTKREAEEWEHLEIIRLKTEKAAPSLAPHVKTIANLCEDWLEATKNGTGERVAVEPTSWMDYELSVRRHIIPHIGNMKLADFRATEVVSFRKTLLENNSRDKSKRVLKHLRQALNHGVEIGWIEANPAISVRIADDKREQKQPKIPSREEMAMILAALDKRAEDEIARGNNTYSWVQFAAFFCLLQGSGMRSSEARALTWDKIDFSSGAITIDQRADKYGGIGKCKSTNAYRRVVVGPMVLEWLKRWQNVAYRSKDNLVFCTRDGAVKAYVTFLQSWYLPLCIDLGLVTKEGRPKYTLHGTRHYRVSEKLDHGTNIKKLMSEIGHGDSDLIYRTYGHIIPKPIEEEQEEARKIEEKIGQILDRRDANPLE